MKLVVTTVARADIDATLRDTGRMFGARQLRTYAEYIERAFAMLLEDPYRASSRERDDIKVGARSLRLPVAAGRARAASHVIYFRVDHDKTAEATVIITRLLHERMEASRHLLEE